MSSRASVVLVSHPVEGASELAKKIIEARLAACAQVLPPMTSIYHWQQRIEQDRECLILLKTLDSIWPDLQQFIKNNHPYTVPEILKWECSAASDSYFKWMLDVLEGESSG